MVTIVCKAAAFTLDNGPSTQYYKFRVGDIIQHLALEEALREARVPLTAGRGVKCPSCRRCFY